jgi:hypothetical protein
MDFPPFILPSLLSHAFVASSSKYTKYISYLIYGVLPWKSVSRHYIGDFSSNIEKMNQLKKGKDA